ncbi:MAG: hypothetical protein KGK07_15145 [Chloroflexota bacterium]|nr:hypothetical protein [Chloroflexota bacterium]
MKTSTYRKDFRRRLARFLKQFPSNAKSWAQATDEPKDIYYEMSEHGTRFPPVGKINCKTPSEWNTKYKAAIWKAFRAMSDDELAQVDRAFGGAGDEGWFK